MEEFSQSRGDDDLFDDEIVPITPSPPPVEAVAAQVEQITLDPAPSQIKAETPPAQAVPTASRGKTRPRGRGRGEQRDQSRVSGLAESKYAPRPANIQSDTPSVQTLDKQTPPPAEPSKQSTPQQDTAAPSSAPTGPANPTPSRPPAVRGDRTATGGVRKPKLTEEELSAKLAAAKERSQNIAAAHARAQADAESFAERERMASAKRAKEKEDRKVLEGERERNRERKLRALGGREWDAGKDEQDLGRGQQPRRQGDFNEEDHDLSVYEWKEDRGRGRGRARGRGGRAGGGGGRGRGDVRNGGGREFERAQPDVHAEVEFPALPTKRETAGERKSLPSREDSGPVTGSWADQVESSEAGKK